MLRTCSAALAGCALALAAAAARAQAPAPRLPLTPCRLEGSPVPAKCGSLQVAEDRSRPGGRQLSIHVAVIPALARTPEPDPLFLFAGGPGQAASRSFGPLIGPLEKVRKKRDLVIVDQRGTGKSAPLACDLEPKEARLEERLAARPFPAARLEACVKKLDADPRQYGTRAAVQDFDAVRQALGYERVNLWGGSYGTRVALVYLRDFPARVRTVTLDGVAPLTMPVPLWFARDAQRALSLLFAACAADAACSKAYPQLEPRFAQLLDRLGKEPARARVADPLTGEPQEIAVDRETFTGLLRGVLYVPDLAVLVPLTIDRAARGDFGPFVAQASTLERGFAKGMSIGLMLSVLCAEDLPLMTNELIEKAAQGTFLGPRLLQEFKRACEVWPHGLAPADYHAPVKSDAPVLLLSGDLDPVTPPSWADEAARTLPNSLHAVAPGVGHGVTATGCAPALLAQFLDDGGVGKLDRSCAAKSTRPPFFVSFAGPTP